MVQNLQKQGPCSLSSLTEAHVFQLVDLLILDKHWVEESTTQTAFPFRLVLPAGKSCPGNGSRKESTKLAGQDGPKPSSSDKSRAQVLGDCQKLLNETLKENPDGFYMGTFKKLFLNKYGYYLDVQMLGYQKLISLLQIMPGVKIESEKVVLKTDPNNSSIIQSRKEEDHLKSDTKEWSKKDKDDDDSESPWEELGPVANSAVPPPKSNRVVKEECALQKKKQLHDYESLSHNHESSSSSDSEEEEMLPEGQMKPRKRKNNEEDSSLLEILDLWYNSKEDNRRRVAASASASDGMVVDSFSKPSGVSSISINNKEVVNIARKQRAPKTYSFVADEPPAGAGDNKDKLISGIIGSLNKSGDVLSEASKI